MAFGYLYPQGLGFTTGDIITTQGAMYSSGRVRYVDSENAQAADSGDGTDELRPWATLVYALGIASTGDTIVLGAEHEETISTVVACATNNIAVVGMASSDGEPTATLNITTGSLSFTGENVTLGNVKVSCTVGSFATYMLRATGERFLGRDLLIEMGADMSATLGLTFSGATSKRLERCTFRSVAAVGSVRPLQGFYCSSTSCRIDIIDCTVDAGEAGFDYTGIEFSSSATKMVNVENLSQLRGGDVIVGSSCVGRIGVSSSTGSARVVVA